MNDNLNTIFSQASTPISEDMIKAYVEGTLSKEDKHFVERQMANDEFLNDAIEGLLLAKERGIDFSKIMDFKSKLPTKTNNSFQLNVKRFYYAAAAGILLLIGIGSLYLYFTNPKISTDNIALNQTESNTVKSVIQEVKPVQPIQETLQMNENVTSEISSNNKKETIKDNFSANDETISNEKKSFKSNTGSTLSEDALAENQNQLKNENKDVSVYSSSTSPAAAIESPTISTQKEVIVLSNTKSTEGINAGSSQDNDNVIVKNKSEELLTFVNANSLFENKQYEKAIGLYNEIRSGSIQYEESQWKIALCYEFMKDNTRLKKQLKNIKNGKGKYASEAEKKLKLLNDK